MIQSYIDQANDRAFVDRIRQTVARLLAGKSLGSIRRCARLKKHCWCAVGLICSRTSCWCSVRALRVVNVLMVLSLLHAFRGSAIAVLKSTQEIDFVGLMHGRPRQHASVRQR